MIYKSEIDLMNIDVTPLSECKQIVESLLWIKLKES